jgi:hypothetical protein
MKFEHSTKFPKHVRSNSFATQVSLENMTWTRTAKQFDLTMRQVGG